MKKKNNNSSEILTSTPYIWSHLSVVIFFHSLGYALLRATGYSENVSLYLAMTLVLIDIILPNLRFPQGKEARKRFHYALKLTFLFSALIYTLIILFAFMSKTEVLAIVFVLGISVIISNLLITFYRKYLFFEYEDVIVLRDTKGKVLRDKEGNPLIEKVKRYKLLELRAADYEQSLGIKWKDGLVIGFSSTEKQLNTPDRSQQKQESDTDSLTKAAD